MTGPKHLRIADTRMAEGSSKLSRGALAFWAISTVTILGIALALAA